MSSPQHVRPEQLDALTVIDAAKRQTYKNALQALWNEYNAAAPGTPARVVADGKLKNATQQIMNHVRASNTQSRQGGQQQTQPNQPQQPNAQPQARPQSQQQSQQSTAANAVARQQALVTSHLTAQQQQTVKEKVQQEVQALSAHLPPSQNKEQQDQHVQTFKKRAYTTLLSKRMLAANGELVSKELNASRSRGQPNPELAAHLQTLKTLNVGLDKQISDLYQQYQMNVPKPGDQQTSKNAAQASIQRPGTQQGVPPTSSGEQQHSQLDTKPTTTNAAPQSTQSPAPLQQHNFQLSQSSPGIMATQNAQQAQQQQTQQSQPSTSQTMQQQGQQQMQQPQSAQLPQASQPNFNMNNQQQPQRAQTNVQQPQNMRQQTQLHQTPTSAIPSSAGQQNQQPHALTHQAAISQAAGEYARQQQAAAQAAQQHSNGPLQQLPSGLPFNGTQHSTPTSAHPYPQSTAPAASKASYLPIPKTLTLSQRSQEAVAGPPSRPTLAGGSMLHQPSIPRPPPFVLEGEGDHVLSKRKLDELVRQVTGSVPDPSGNNNPVLDPDVEESILQVADDFVDNVITAACKLAKLRPNQTLDVRDVQLVLERNYGIRIPGFSLDEVRTVRKFHPAPGWQSKMQAIQASKVMGGQRDA